MLRGLGDDAAVLRLRSPTLITVDVLVENVHFRRGWGTARQLGYKAFAVNASDIAAMGGQATHALIDLRAPAATPVRFLGDLYRGFQYAARREGAVLVGGNTSRAATLSVGVTLLGWAPHGYLTRDRCRVGHDLYVTGTLGLAALGLRALRARRPRGSAAVRRFLEPPLRGALARALARTGLCGGMIDVSDGCLQDLGHLCAASGVGAEVEVERVPIGSVYRRLYGRSPRLALGGGEDYELLFSAHPALASRLAALTRHHRCAISRIGRVVVAERGIQLLSRSGQSLPPAQRGHDHFR